MTMKFVIGDDFMTCNTSTTIRKYDLIHYQSFTRNTQMILLTDESNLLVIETSMINQWLFHIDKRRFVWSDVASFWSTSFIEIDLLSFFVEQMFFFSKVISQWLIWTVEISSWRSFVQLQSKFFFRHLFKHRIEMNFSFTLFVLFSILFSNEGQQLFTSSIFTQISTNDCSPIKTNQQQTSSSLMDLTTNFNEKDDEWMNRNQSNLFWKKIPGWNICSSLTNENWFSLKDIHQDIFYKIKVNVFDKCVRSHFNTIDY